MSSNDVKGKIRTKWDEAISDANRKIKALEAAIAFYRKSKKAGDPWPTERATEN